MTICKTQLIASGRVFSRRMRVRWATLAGFMETMCTETDIGLLVIGAAAHSLATQSSGTLTTALVSSKNWLGPGRKGREVDAPVPWTPARLFSGSKHLFPPVEMQFAKRNRFFGMPALRVLHALKSPLPAHCALSRNCFLRTPLNSAAS